MALRFAGGLPDSVEVPSLAGCLIEDKREKKGKKERGIHVLWPQHTASVVSRYDPGRASLLGLDLVGDRLAAVAERRLTPQY